MATGDEWSIKLYPVEPNGGVDPWTIGAYDSIEDSIFFIAPATGEPIKLKLLGDGAQTVTYFVNGTNYILTSGWVQVSVNTTDLVATVQLDVWSGDISFNGTSQVPLAP